jgi:polar amino acid transport system substrate-binding protein
MSVAIVAAALGIVSRVRSAGEAGQDAQRPEISTMTGVFTAAQATRGEDTYMAICVSCHPRGTYTTAAFKETWTGRPLSELFDLVREKMPKNDPGSLTPGEYAQAVAYLLKINDVPAGEEELPPDSEALKKIRIEMPAGQ